ncbi:MAG: ATP-binding protein [Anaerolineales bacterium]
MFFGRSRELQEIAQFLRGNQSVSLDGPPGIGKTSLLLHLTRPRAAEELGLWNDSLVSYIDCAVLEDESSKGVFRYFASMLIVEMESRSLPEEVELRKAAASPTRLAFESAVRALNRRGLQIVFLLDHFDRLSMNSRLDLPFFIALRSAAGRFRLAYLTASASPLIDLTYSGRSGEILSSPFFNIFAPLHLGLLPEEDARDLIQKPVQRTGHPFSTDMSNFLYRLAGGHPLILQTACYHAMECPDNRAKIEERTIREIKPYIENIWLSLTAIEKQTLLGMAGTSFSNAIAGSDAAVLSRLEGQCLLIQANGGYVSPCKVWMDFLNSRSTSLGTAQSEEVHDR